jgi:hypothetical protein
LAASPSKRILELTMDFERIQSPSEAQKALPGMRNAVYDIWKGSLQNHLDRLAHCGIPVSFAITQAGRVSPRIVRRLALVSEKVVLEDPLSGTLFFQAVVNESERAHSFERSLAYVKELKSLIEAGVVEFVPSLAKIGEDNRSLRKNKFIAKAVTLDEGNASFAQAFGEASEIQGYIQHLKLHYENYHDKKLTEKELAQRSLYPLSKAINSMIYSSESLNLVPIASEKIVWSAYCWKLSELGKLYKARSKDILVSESVSKIRLPALNNASNEDVLKIRSESTSVVELREYFSSKVTEIQKSKSAEEAEGILSPMAESIQMDVVNYRKELENLKLTHSSAILKGVGQTALPIAISIVSVFGLGAAGLANYVPAVSSLSGAGAIFGTKRMYEEIIDWRKERLEKKSQNTPVSILIDLGSGDEEPLIH